MPTLLLGDGAEGEKGDVVIGSGGGNVFIGSGGGDVFIDDGVGNEVGNEDVKEQP